MANDWEGFRQSLEAEGFLFCDEEAQLLPRIYEKNQNRWNHIRRMILMIQKRNPELVVDTQLDLATVFVSLLQVIKKKKSVIFVLDELLELLHEIDREEGDFDFEQGTTSAYVHRVKQAFLRAKEEYLWRKGKSPEDCRPSFLIGAPPKIPKSSDR
jgi:hypothetical protein